MSDFDIIEQSCALVHTFPDTRYDKNNTLTDFIKFHFAYPHVYELFETYADAAYEAMLLKSLGMSAPQDGDADFAGDVPLEHRTKSSTTRPVRYSANAVIEKLRWYVNIDTSDLYRELVEDYSDENANFKLPSQYCALYSRMYLFKNRFRTGDFFLCKSMMNELAFNRWLAFYVGGVVYDDAVYNPKVDKVVTEINVRKSRTTGLPIQSKHYYFDLIYLSHDGGLPYDWRVPTNERKSVLVPKEEYNND